MSTYMTHRRTLIGLPALLLLLFGTSAQAGYVSETGAVQVISPPPSLALGALQSDTIIQTFIEQQQLVLSNSVAVDDTASGTFLSNATLVAGTIAAGTSVDSYFFHSNPVNPGQVYDGSVTFSTAILGVIVLSGSLDATDSLLGYSNTIYPTGDSGRGIELSPTEDSFTLSADKKTLIFHFDTHFNLDEVRVLTAPTVPEPSSLSLLCIGTLIPAGVSLLRRLKAKRF